MESNGKCFYVDYCDAVGNVNFQGNPLPTWEELQEDRQVGWNALAKRYVKIDDTNKTE
jgi:hypothetical protein